MGKRRFAGTLESGEHQTDTSKYANKNLTAWIRGWDHGVEVIAFASGDDDVFEIYTCGGSHARSNGRRLIGKVVNGEFRRMN
jgi:hypothetical protein